MRGNRLLPAGTVEAIQRTLAAEGKHYDTEDILATIDEMDDYWPEEWEKSKWEES